MKSNAYSIILLIAVLMLVPAALPAVTAQSGEGSAAHAAGGSPTHTDQGKKEKTVDLSESYNEFGFDLYARMVDEHPADNIFISPTSISLALAMTLGGADGETEEAMLKTMRLPSADRAGIGEANRHLMERLTSTGTGVELSIANSLWLRKDFPFNNEFVERSKRSFSAEVFNLLDAARINGWVDEKTNGKIKDIIDSVRPDDIAVLVNAIYFKGVWRIEFDPEETGEEAFHLQDGRTEEIPMMRRSGDFRYFENDSLQAVSLPYGDRSVAMYVFLPKAGTSLASFHARLDGERWDTMMGQFTFREGSLRLPRFTCEFKTSLIDALDALGMGIAFAPAQADFSRMCGPARGNVAIGEVVHKAFIEVNEEGTEAAAATAVKMKLTAVGIRPEPFSMIVDRPFFIAIRDEGSGTILFMGSIYEPVRPE